MEIGEVLEPLYRMQGAWNALIGVHEVSSRISRPGERVAMMHRVAEIAEDKAGDSRWRSVDAARAARRSPRTSTPTARSSALRA